MTAPFAFRASLATLIVAAAPAAADSTERTPARGAAEVAQAAGVEGAVVTRVHQVQVIPQSWGELTWYTSAELGNSTSMTTGQAVVSQGKANPRHYHPNCDEILRVVRGRIIHSIGDHTVEMGPGDIVTIPVGMKHNAKNIGSEDAVLALSFSSAYRETVGE